MVKLIENAYLSVQIFLRDIIKFLLEVLWFSNKLFLLDERLVALIFFKEESPGSAKTQCQVIPGGGNPRDSATENIPP
jgi:hypothetical protein